MSEMLKIIKDSTEKILKDFSTKDTRDLAEKGEWAEELWTIVAESGFTSIGISETKGGAGGDYVDAFEILRLTGRYASPIPIAETLIVNWMLAELDTELLVDPATFFISSEKTFQIQMKDNQFIVNGEANKVPWGRYAKEILVLADYAGSPVITLLPMKYACINKGYNLANEPSENIHFNYKEIDQLKLYDCRKDEVIKKITYLSGLAKAAMMSGALEKVLSLTLEYVREREQFGRPIHRFQAVQQQIAMMSGEVAAAKAMTNQAIQTFGKEGFEQEVASAKIKVNEAAGKVTEIAHQLHGAIGATHEHELHQFTKRLWAWRDESGNEDKWAEELTSQFVNTDKTSIWELISDKPTKIQRENINVRSTFYS